MTVELSRPALAALFVAVPVGLAVPAAAGVTWWMIIALDVAGWAFVPVVALAVSTPPLALMVAVVAADRYGRAA